jgi:hypothetical protein
MRRRPDEGKYMFNKRLTEELREFGLLASGLRAPQKKEPRYERLSGVNREASNRVAPTTR